MFKRARTFMKHSRITKIKLIYDNINVRMERDSANNSFKDSLMLFRKTS